jgi:hypothetical protein
MFCAPPHGLYGIVFSSRRGRGWYPFTGRVFRTQESRHENIAFLLVSVDLHTANDNAEQKNSRFPLGNETAYVPSPLDADGYIEYAAVLSKSSQKSKILSPFSESKICEDGLLGLRRWNMLAEHASSLGR